MATGTEAVYACQLYKVRIFPVVAGAKKPPTISEFYIHATDNPELIVAMWGEHNYNIGILCDTLLVLDVDPRRNANAWEQVDALLGSNIDTLVVKTASDGFHVVFRLPEGYHRHLRALIVPIEGVDIRAFHNYVLGVGSEVEAENSSNGEYGWYRIAIDLPIAEAPAHLLDACRETLVYQARPGELNNSPASVVGYTEWLIRTDPAIEGANGEPQTYATAVKGRDFGLTEDTTLDLMLTYWNNNCRPPWEPDELALKVRNAYAYAKGEAGVQDVTRTFANVKVVEPTSLALISQMVEPIARPDDPYSVDNDIGSLRLDLIHEPEPTKFLVYPFAVRGLVTGIAGRGNTGKSITVLSAVLHLAGGRDFMTKVPQEPIGVLMYATEDDVDHLRGRIISAIQHHGLDAATVAKNLYLMPHLPRLKLLRRGRNGSELNEPAIDYLRRILNKIPNIGVFVADPFRAIHTAQENDNDAMAMLIEEVLSNTAKDFNISVIFIHHPPKENTGNQDPFRGASTIRETPRLVFQQDVVSTAGDNIVELTIVKGNIIDMRSIKPLTFKISGYMLNGGSYPVIDLLSTQQAADVSKGAMLNVLVDEYVKATAEAGKTLSLGRAVSALQKAGLLKKYGGRNYDQTRQQHVDFLSALLVNPVQHQYGNHLFHLKHDGRGNIVDVIPDGFRIHVTAVAPAH